MVLAATVGFEHSNPEMLTQSEIYVRVHVSQNISC